jgi:HD superfamily phosphodiesterase
MNPLTIETAREFAIEKFGKFPELEKQLKIKHSEYIIKAAEELVKEKGIENNININRIEIAAWLHDIGYIVSEEGHAEYSLRISKEKFELDSIIEDCILNHDSKGKPVTKEGKIIQLADKLNLFYPEMKKIYVESLIGQGRTKEEAEKKLLNRLENYKEKFSDKEYQKIIFRLLKEK